MARPRAKIDWEKAERLAQAGCNGVQIAAYMGIHEDTLYGACERELKTGFSAWLANKRSKGDAMILARQFESALKDKDRAMLIWLGKQRLNQRERRDYDHTSNGQALPLIQPVFVDPDKDGKKKNKGGSDAAKG